MTRTDGIITIFDMERMLLPPFSSLLWEESRDFNSDIEDEARHLSKIESSDSFTQTWFFFSTLRKYFRIQDDDAFWLAYETNQSTKMKSEDQFLRRHKTREKRAKFSSIFETFKRGGGFKNLRLTDIFGELRMRRCLKFFWHPRNRCQRLEFRRWERDKSTIPFCTGVDLVFQLWNTAKK